MTINGALSQVRSPPKHLKRNRPQVVVDIVGCHDAHMHAPLETILLPLLAAKLGGPLSFKDSNPGSWYGGEDCGRRANATSDGVKSLG